MAKLVHDLEGERFYETGIEQGVLFVKSDNPTPKKEHNVGVVFNGLTTVSESPSGAEANPMYADDIKYLNLYSEEEFGATIEAYYSPEEFDECDGSVKPTGIPGLKVRQQTRKPFCFAYKSKIGNDEMESEYGWKYHIIFNAKASPTEVSRESMNDSPEAPTMSWELTTTKVKLSQECKEKYGIKKDLSYLEFEFANGETDTQVLAVKKALDDLIYGVDVPLFDKTKESYAIGDVVNHPEAEEAEKLYKCKTAISAAGEWDAEKWDALTADEAFEYQSHILMPEDLLDYLYDAANPTVSKKVEAKPAFNTVKKDEKKIPSFK